jgi:glycosyltransferase involved in cell wall biosynthesis
MARIGVSLLFIKPGKVGGAEPFAYNVLAGINSLETNHQFVLFVYEDTYPLVKKIGFSSRFVIIQVKRRTFFNRFIDETFLLPSLLKKQCCEMIWLPNYFLPPFFRFKTVVSVMDLQFRHLPELFTPLKRLWLNVVVPYAIKKATVLTTIRQRCASDINLHFGIKVLPLKIPINLGRPISNRDSEEDVAITRLLIIAQQYKHKNIVTPIKALSKIKDENIHLDVVGQVDSGSVDVSNAVAACKQNISIELHGYVHRDRLEELLCDCDVLVFPSLFEGFGMPVVEAMMLNKFVVMSDLPVLREVSFGCGQYVSTPKETNSWERAIKETVARVRSGEHCNYKDRFIEGYSPPNVAVEYINVFEQCLESRTKN